MAQSTLGFCNHIPQGPCEVPYSSASRLLLRGPVWLELTASASPIAVVPVPTANSRLGIRYPHQRPMSQVSVLSPSTKACLPGPVDQATLAGFYCPCLGGEVCGTGLEGNIACRPGTVRKHDRQPRNVVLPMRLHTKTQVFLLNRKQLHYLLPTFPRYEEHLYPSSPL